MHFPRSILLTLVTIAALHQLALAAPVVVNDKEAKLQSRDIGMNGFPDNQLTRGGTIAAREPGLNSNPYWPHGFDIQGGPGEAFEPALADEQPVVVDIPDFDFDPSSLPDE
ncbi:uncharacterized protein AB675_4218 [Cyphellophora attinorum]|uniref:Uncharacterized protein n=1 Tax=Cyphellophora attinorum TaxID=1664694 RepID=A0A0N1H904_9EURO|nr:uncharacterized protein AB675_4218 [Phialophora attinorum]KPI38533.1 hypothetical protein AB675_4218 [Phialophora attinorum]